MRPPPRSTLFPYTTLFRSRAAEGGALPGATRHQLERPGLDLGAGRSHADDDALAPAAVTAFQSGAHQLDVADAFEGVVAARSEEHTSELQSQSNLVCRLLLDAATTEIYPLSLHDALPISRRRRRCPSRCDPSPAGTAGS